jgi:2-haloacid dehalogenase
MTLRGSFIEAAYRAVNGKQRGIMIRRLATISRREFLQAGAVATIGAEFGPGSPIASRTAFVARPLEYGPDGKPDLKADSSVDVSAKDLNDLAGQLGA